MERFRKERYELDNFMPRGNTETSLGIFDLQCCSQLHNRLRSHWLASDAPLGWLSSVTEYEVVSDCSAVAEGRCQTLGGDDALGRRSTARHVNLSLLEPINRSAPENSRSTQQQFSGMESINSKE